MEGWGGAQWKRAYPLLRSLSSFSQCTKTKKNPMSIRWVTLKYQLIPQWKRFSRKVEQIPASSYAVRMHVP